MRWRRSLSTFGRILPRRGFGTGRLLVDGGGGGPPGRTAGRRRYAIAPDPTLGCAGEVDEGLRVGGEAGGGEAGAGEVAPGGRGGVVGGGGEGVDRPGG